MFEAAADAAERSFEAIESGRRNTERRANNRSDTVRNPLDAVENELDAQRGENVSEAEYLIFMDRLENAREGRRCCRGRRKLKRAPKLIRLSMVLLMYEWV